MDIDASPRIDDLLSSLHSYRGPVDLPGTGRQIWWTGRVAIGLRFEPVRSNPLCGAETWIQEQVLRRS